MVGTELALPWAAGLFMSGLILGLLFRAPAITAASVIVLLVATGSAIVHPVDTLIKTAVNTVIFLATLQSGYLVAVFARNWLRKD